MPDGFVNLQSELRAVENNRPRAFRALRGFVQSHRFFADAVGVARQVHGLNQFVTLQSVLAAEAVGIRALLNLVVGKAGGHDARAGLHLHLMNVSSGGGNENLLDPPEIHGGLGQGNAFYAAHLLIRGKQKGQLAFERNAEGVLDKRILPGVGVSLFRSEHNVAVLGQRRGVRDVNRLGGAGLHAFTGQAVGGGKAPSPLGDDADADAQRFALAKRADFPVLGGEIAPPYVHHPRVGIGCAAPARGIKGGIGEVKHVEPC